MDLLRLVLARQPAAKLVQFQRLSRDPIFRRTRQRIFDIRSTKIKNLVEESTLAGDLSPESQLYAVPSQLANRAIFLCNPGVYHIFADLESISMDFWKAMESGIPEIQARAIVILRNMIPDWAFSSLQKLNNSAMIPWTPALRQEIAISVTQLQQAAENDTPSEMFRILGLLGLPLPGGISSHKIYAITLYYVEKIRYTLRWRPQFEYDSRLASDLADMRMYGDIAVALLRSGYFYPLLIELRDNLEYIVREAVEIYSFEFLGYVVDNFDLSTLPKIGRDITHGSTLGPITILTVERVRACLNDPKIVALLTDEMLDEYMIIAGYPVTGNTVTFHKVIGNPGGSGKDGNSYRPVSIQSAVMYDPVWSANTMDQKPTWIDYLAKQLAFFYGRANELKSWDEPHIYLTKVAVEAGKNPQNWPSYPTVEDINYLASRGVVEGEDIMIDNRQAYEKQYNEVLANLKRNL